MATLRRPHLAHVLIACACSGADPSASGTTIEGVYALESLTCDSNSPCPEENTAGAALARGHVWLTRDYIYCANPNGDKTCTTFTLHAGLGEATFGADGGLSMLEQTPDVQATSVSSGVGVAPDESVAYFAYTNDAKGLVQIQGFSGGADAGIGQIGQKGYVTGVVADGRSTVVGVVATNNTMGFGSEQLDQGSGGISANSSGVTGSSLYRVNLEDGGVTQRSADFDVTITHHLMVSSGGSIYGIGSGGVWVVPVDLSAAPATVGTIPAAQTGSACQPPSNCVSSGVGLDAANGVVAWSVLQGTSVCNSGPCTFTSPSCSVWKNGASPSQPTRIYQNAQQGCLGLAIDATYAYFALVTQQPSSCSGCNSYDVYTTAIARVALNGADTQQPTLLQLDSTRLYGPRRFFADDTYVYGVDPAYVLRIPKTAFGP